MKINNLASLRRETERLEYKLKVDKSKLKTDFQLLRFRIFEYALKEVLGIFKRKPAAKKSVSKKPVDKKHSTANNISSDKTPSAEKSSSSKKSSNPEKNSSSEKKKSTKE